MAGGAKSSEIQKTFRGKKDKEKKKDKDAAAAAAEKTDEDKTKEKEEREDMTAQQSELPGSIQTTNRLLEDQIWYHGFRPRKDIQHLLSAPGDFLVRASDRASDRTDIVISFMSAKNTIANLTVKFEDGFWVLGVMKKSAKKPHKFGNVVDMVDYYGTKKVPGGAGCKLSKPIPKPKWLIKHDQCKYDKKKDLLGSGNFCAVFKGVYERSKDDILDVAIKICHGSEEEKTAGEAQKAREDMLHEAQLMSYYVHENVIRLFGVACDHPPVIIVMEFCPGGSLVGHLEKKKGAIAVGERILYCFEAARGMRYLHSQNCIHRDLAARNCLISAKGQIKISDFGLSKMAEELSKEPKEGEQVEKQHIPLRWMAPESLRKPQVFSQKTDVWSFGVLVYEIFNDGAKPWPDDENKKIATHIRKGKMPALPEITPAEMKELVAKMWNLNAEERPTMRKLTGSIFELHKTKYQAPDKFTLNDINGVTRNVRTYEGDETMEHDDILPESGKPKQRRKSSKGKEKKEASLTESKDS